MNTFDVQSKSNKVAATQEITAQNSDNQSDKLFGTFTEDEMRNIVENSGQNFYRPNYVINYLKRAEHILDKARMSQDSKDFIKGAFQMMTDFGQWNTKTKYEFCVQRDDPDDIRQMIENGEDEDDIIDSLVYEMGTICGDLQNDEDLWFDEYEVEQAKEALDEFYSIITEYGLEEKMYREKQYGWTLDEAKKVLAE